MDRAHTPAATANGGSFLSFGGYDTIKGTFLVGPLQGNFFASFAVGWLCTTVSTSILLSCVYGMDTDGLLSRARHLPPIRSTRSAAA